VVGFYCKECAGAAIGLSGQRRDPYPESVCLVELPCIGRVSALHIVEAARLGAAGVFLAGCASGRCQYRSGDASAAEQLSVADELLKASGRDTPLELWHLCAVDRQSVGRHIREFEARATGRTAPDRTTDSELLVGAAADNGACEARADRRAKDGRSGC
jgi:F420-non-reducing hydrogenase iron-sulfur subunit